jgi:hypothetical protein
MKPVNIIYEEEWEKREINGGDEPNWSSYIYIYIYIYGNATMKCPVLLSYNKIF